MSHRARCLGWIPVSIVLLHTAAAAQLLFGPDTVSEFTPTSSFVRCDVADVDGNGTVDLVTATGGNIRWYPGNGAGSFGFTGTIVPGVSGVEIHLADLDGDGRKDLIAATTATATMQVALADAEGGFGRATDYALNPLGVAGMSLASGDSDADGDLDVLAVTRGPLGFAGEARLFLNDGSGALELGTIVPGDAEHIVIGGLTGSLDGDELPDLVVVTQFNSLHTSTAWLGQPGGGAEAVWSTTGKEGVTRIADFDGDGDADLLASTAYLLEPVVVATHLGAGDGEFTAGPMTALQFSVFGTVFTDAADVDEDGLADLAVTLPGNPPELWVVPGDGAGGFELPGARVSLLPVVGVSSNARVGPFADFDNDGRLDVACQINPPFETRFGVSLNETYPQGGALLDLGHQLEGGNGWPIQVASGSFVGGTGFSFALSQGPPLASVFHVVGFSTIDAPFKGGTMVPMPNLITGPWPTNNLGSALISGHWPTGAPPGIEIAAQFWFASVGAPAGFASSSAVLITTP